jgi:hypothetical protein
LRASPETVAEPVERALERVALLLHAACPLRNGRVDVVGCRIAGQVRRSRRAERVARAVSATPFGRDAHAASFRVVSDVLVQCAEIGERVQLNSERDDATVQVIAGVPVRQVLCRAPASIRGAE